MPCSRKNSSKVEPICGFFFLILISPKGRCIKIDTPRQAPSFRPIGTSEAQRCTKKYQKETGRVRGKGGPGFRCAPSGLRGLFLLPINLRRIEHLLGVLEIQD